MSVTVSAQYGGTPAAKVTVKAGKAAVCVITLASGKGSCKLTATRLRVGGHALTAAYSGSTDFTSSASARKTHTVVKKRRRAR